MVHVHTFAVRIVWAADGTAMLCSKAGVCVMLEIIMSLKYYSLGLVLISLFLHKIPPAYGLAMLPEISQWSACPQPCKVGTVILARATIYRSHPPWQPNSSCYTLQKETVPQTAAVHITPHCFSFQFSRRAAVLFLLNSPAALPNTDVCEYRFFFSTFFFFFF